MKTDRPQFNLTRRQILKYSALGTLGIVLGAKGVQELDNYLNKPSQVDLDKTPTVPLNEENPEFIISTGDPHKDSLYAGKLPADMLGHQPAYDDQEYKSPNGDKSIIMRDSGASNHNPDLYLNDNGEETFLVHGAYSPKWNQDEELVSYMVDRNGTHGVGVLNPANPDKRVEIFTDLVGTTIDWSAEGDKIMVWTGPDNDRPRYILDVAHLEKEQTSK